MKKTLKFLSYFVLILVILLFLPSFESLKINDVNLKKKVLSVFKTETQVLGGSKEGASNENSESKEEGEEDYPELDTAVVKRVIDGDTVVLEDGRKIRYIGMNTPEKDQKFGLEATLKNKELTEGREIVLEFDKGLYDKYGRTLAYVYTEDYFVNLELLKEGCARLMTIPPNTKYQAELKKALKEAQDNKLGIWKDK